MNSHFLAFVEEQMYRKIYAKRFVQTYSKWINGFIRFHSNQHQSVLFDQHVEQYLSYLVSFGDISSNKASRKIRQLNDIRLLIHEHNYRPKLVSNR
jgi:hypothetical protein